MYLHIIYNIYTDLLCQTKDTQFDYSLSNPSFEAVVAFLRKEKTHGWWSLYRPGTWTALHSCLPCWHCTSEVWCNPVSPRWHGPLSQTGTVGKQNAFSYATAKSFQLHYVGACNAPHCPHAQDHLNWKLFHCIQQDHTFAPHVIAVSMPPPVQEGQHYRDRLAASVSPNQYPSPLQDYIFLKLKFDASHLFKSLHSTLLFYTLLLSPLSATHSLLAPPFFSAHPKPVEADGRPRWVWFC